MRFAKAGKCRNNLYTYFMIVEKAMGMMDENIKKLCDICRLYTDIRLNRPNSFKNMYTYFVKTH